MKHHSILQRSRNFAGHPSQTTTQELPSLDLLLYLEWMVLGFTTITVLAVGPLVMPPNLWVFTLMSIIALAAMRLKLPVSHQPHKIIYTALEGVILLFPSLSLQTGPPFFPILGLVVVMRSCLMFHLPGRLIVSGLTFSAFAFPMLIRHDVPRGLLEQARNSPFFTTDPHVATLTLKLNAACSFGLALFFVLLLINALLEEHQSRAKLTTALKQLRRYALQIEDQSALQERNRIAREIHDSLGHTLTAQSIQIDTALFLLNSDQIEQSYQFLTETKCLCKQALQEVRQSVTTLRKNPLTDQSLETLTQSLIQEFQVTTTIATHSNIHLKSSIPAEVTSAIYRIIQEALTNIIRHSDATQVNLQLYTKRGLLYLTLNDNGRGFNPKQNSTGFGLKGMKERASALGGEWTLTSQPDAGCEISVKVPLVKLLAS